MAQRWGQFSYRSPLTMSEVAKDPYLRYFDLDLTGKVYITFYRGYQAIVDAIHDVLLQADGQIPYSTTVFPRLQQTQFQGYGWGRRPSDEVFFFEKGGTIHHVLDCIIDIASQKKATEDSEQQDLNPTGSVEHILSGEPMDLENSAEGSGGAILENESEVATGAVAEVGAEVDLDKSAEDSEQATLESVSEIATAAVAAGVRAEEGAGVDEPCNDEINVEENLARFSSLEDSDDGYEPAGVVEVNANAKIEAEVEEEILPICENDGNFDLCRRKLGIWGSLS